MCFHDGFPCITLCNYALNNRMRHKTPGMVLMPVGGGIYGASKCGNVMTSLYRVESPICFMLKPQFFPWASTVSIYAWRIWCNSVYGLPRRKIKDSCLCAPHKSLRERGRGRVGEEGRCIHDETKNYLSFPAIVNRWTVINCTQPLDNKMFQYMGRKTHTDIYHSNHKNSF